MVVESPLVGASVVVSSVVPVPVVVLVDVDSVGLSVDSLELLLQAASAAPTRMSKGRIAMGMTTGGSHPASSLSMDPERTRQPRIRFRMRRRSCVLRPRSTSAASW
jgi:hypothetical protein